MALNFIKNHDICPTYGAFLNKTKTKNRSTTFSPTKFNCVISNNLFGKIIYLIAKAFNHQILQMVLKISIHFQIQIPHFWWRKWDLPRSSVLNEQNWIEILYRTEWKKIRWSNQKCSRSSSFKSAVKAISFTSVEIPAWRKSQKVCYRHF